MKLLMYGINRNTSSEEDLPSYLLTDAQVAVQLDDIIQFDGVKDLFIINSSEFTEYYFNVDEMHFRHGDFLNYLSQQTSYDLEKVIMDSYSKFNGDIVNHLYRLLSGISLHMDNDRLIEQVEKNLKYNGRTESAPFIHYLISTVLRYVTAKRSKQDYFELFRSKSDLVLQTFVKSFHQLKNNRFYLWGLKRNLIPLGKKLHRGGALHLTLDCLDCDTSLLVKELNVWSKDYVSKQSQPSFFSAMQGYPALYYLSNADGIYLDEDLQENYPGLEDVNVKMQRQIQYTDQIRYNDKKQIFVGWHPSIKTYNWSKSTQQIEEIKQQDAIDLNQQDHMQEVMDHYLAQVATIRQQILMKYEKEMA